MKKIILASCIMIASVSCKKEKTDSANNNCGTIIGRDARNCDPQTGCQWTVTVLFPDNTTSNFYENGYLGSFPVGGTYCK